MHEEYIKLMAFWADNKQATQATPFRGGKVIRGDRV